MGVFSNGNARVNSKSPRAFGICDCCGFQFNLVDLKFQMQWFGLELRQTGFRHCPECLDIPNPTDRPVILPADPDPVLFPRPDRSVGGTILLEGTTQTDVIVQETYEGTSGNEIVTERP